MNIFATYPCPIKSARVLDDQRLVKMTLESCQLLCTTAHKVGKGKSEFTKPTHANHPCAVWTREGRENFEWLIAHVLEMDAERKRRWGREVTHKTLERILTAGIERVGRRLPQGFTPHANCARNASLGLDFTHIKDVHKAYRRYLSARWILQPRPAICTIKGYLLLPLEV